MAQYTTPQERSDQNMVRKFLEWHFNLSPEQKMQFEGMVQNFQGVNEMFGKDPGFSQLRSEGAIRRRLMRDDPMTRGLEGYTGAQGNLGTARIGDLLSGRNPSSVPNKAANLLDSLLPGSSKKKERKRTKAFKESSGPVKTPRGSYKGGIR